MFHLLTMHEPFGSELTFETDRMHVTARGTARLKALDVDARPSGSAGSVLDPGAGAIIDLVTGIADTRAACMALINKYHDRQGRPMAGRCWSAFISAKLRRAEL